MLACGQGRAAWERVKGRAAWERVKGRGESHIWMAQHCVHSGGVCGMQ